MSRQPFSFTVGEFKCTVLCDGTHTYAPPTFPPPPVMLFANAEPGELERVLLDQGLDPAAWDRWNSDYLCLLVETGDHTVLVDTGAGALGEGTGRILKQLGEAGRTPEAIDTVVITHGHPDHIGGLTRDDGSLVFANARYFMSRREWAFWTTGEAASRFEEPMRDVLLGLATKHLPPLRGRLEAVEGEAEIAGGVTLVPAPGHTPGHSAVAFASRGEQLVFLADTVIHPGHLKRPDWHSIFDLDPADTIATRHRMLGRCSEQRALTLLFHFPHPALGNIVANGEGFRFEPLPRSST